MDSHSDRYDVDDTDYDGSNEKRWYYSLYSNRDGQWLWEPRTPTAAELAAPHALGGVSWKPAVVTEAEWPSSVIRGPHAQRGDAIGAAEDWFDSRL
jgi:hypothetical protein